MENKPSAAGMKLLANLTGRDESFWRPTSRVLLSRAMQDFQPMPQSDRVTRQSVHDTYGVFKTADQKKAQWDNSRVSRTTGHSQIDDMVRSGQVRPPEFTQKTRKDKVYWSLGAAKPGSESLAYGGKGIILEASSKIKGLNRPLALDEVTVKAQTKPGVWQDITDQVRSAHRAYKKQLSNLPPKVKAAAALDTTFAGPASTQQFVGDAYAMGLMGGTAGSMTIPPRAFYGNAPTP